MTVFYEWDAETTTTRETAEHEAGEVLDHDHARSYREALANAAKEAPEGCALVVVLVRDDDNGRAWAYVEAGALPSHFHDAEGRAVARVPARFHAEVKRAT